MNFSRPKFKSEKLEFMKPLINSGLYCFYVIVGLDYNYDYDYDYDYDYLKLN